jgi:hypothetical protein
VNKEKRPSVFSARDFGVGIILALFPAKGQDPVFSSRLNRVEAFASQGLLKTLSRRHGERLSVFRGPFSFPLTS